MSLLWLLYSVFFSDDGVQSNIGLGSLIYTFYIVGVIEFFTTHQKQKEKSTFLSIILKREFFSTECFFHSSRSVLATVLVFLSFANI